MKNRLQQFALVLLCLTLVCQKCDEKKNEEILTDIKKADMELNGKTIATIPPSDVWPPRLIQEDILKSYQKLYPLNLASSVEKTVDSFPVRLVELRGWLRDIHQKANEENEGEWKDWRYNLELDPEWLDSLKIDFNQIFKVGNLYIDGTDWVRVGRLIIHVELNGWDDSIRTMDKGTNGRPLNPLYKITFPLGWQTYNVDPQARNVYWPYNPRHPLYWQDPLEDGQYVRMYGSIVTDDPHQHHKTDIQGNSIKALWNGLGRAESDPSHPAQWTEMHSPDIISVLKHKDKKETDTAVAICADISHTPQTLNITLRPPGTKPRPTAHAEVTELVGPESDLGTITAGRIAPTGSSTVFAGAFINNMGDSANISIAVSYSPFRTGLFKAIYRVKWVD